MPGAVLKPLSFLITLPMTVSRFGLGEPPQAFGRPVNLALQCMFFEMLLFPYVHIGVSKIMVFTVNFQYLKTAVVVTALQIASFSFSTAHVPGSEWLR
jgi:hypothetical protein